MKVGSATGPSIAMEGLESRTHFAANLPEGFVETKYVADLPEVTSMDFAPDGRLFITEVAGSVRVITAGGTKLSTPFMTIPVDRYNNRGLIGLEFDPNFSVNRYIYVFYSTRDPNNPNVKDNDSVNRISRFTASNTNKDTVQAGSEVILVDNIPNEWGGHNGGSMNFGKDGMLYITTGEAAVRTLAQDLNSLGGKILRLNVKNYPNSIIPSDNPFVGQTGKRPEIWAYGLRHPYTSAIHPVSGLYYANDVGEDTWEEINEIQKGRNYGWDKVEGNSSNTSYKNPVYTYNHNGTGAAVVGSAFYTGTKFPAEYKDKFFFADFEDNWMKYLDPATKPVKTFATNLRRAIDIDQGPDGALYYLAYNDRYSTTDNRSVYKFDYVGAGNRAPAADYTVTPTTGTAPLTVTFDASNSSDPDGDPLTFLWDFGDGTTSTEMVVTHTYTEAGTYQPTLVATDPGGLFDHDTLPVINANNSAPVGTITLPAGGSTYRAGDTISFAGTGTDAEDGTLGASAFDWSIRLHHNDHDHPFLTFNDITEGSFQLPNPLDETSPNQWYRITLTVTDSAGGKHTSFMDVTPLLSTVTLTTNVAGLKLTLDGQTVNDGHSFTGVENALRTIGVQTVQSLNGKFYQFDSWSDGGAASHDVATPVDDATFTANFVEIPMPESATLNPVADGYVRNGSFGNTNYGDSIDLLIKQSATAGNSREAYVTFDTSAAAPGGTAKLRFFGQLGNLTGTIKPVPVGVYGVSNTSWAEDGLTYNTRPATGALLKTTNVVTGAPQWYEWDVTAYVEAEKAAGRNVVSFALRATANTDPFAMFESKEAASMPQLVLAPKPPSQDIPLPSIAEGFVRNGGFANTNYGNDGLLNVKLSGTSGNSRESVLKFDISTLPATFSAAKLRLFGMLTNVLDSGTPQVGVFKSIYDAWTETGLTWNNRPATSGGAIAVKPITGTTGQWYEWDLTSMIQAERAAGNQILTLVLRATNTTNPMATFNSGEAASNTPELLVTT